MNRREIRRRKLLIEKQLPIIAKRQVSLETEYNELRAQIEPLPGDSPERAELHKKAAVKLLELQKKNAEFSNLMREHNQMTYASEYNRDNIENGKVIKAPVKDGSHNNIQPT